MTLKLNNTMSLKFFKLTRTIHPVGQGAFYTEVFSYGDENNFTVVYDCGTETDTKDLTIPLEQQVDDFKKGIKQIDLLFISHFHKDHISGLVRLIDGIKVCKTVIPMLSEEMVTLARVQNFLRYRQDALDADSIISDLYLSKETSGRFGEVVVVEPFDYSDYSESVSFKGNGVKIKNVDSIAGYDKFWEYIPFNSVNCKDRRAINFGKGLKKIPDAFDSNGDLNTEKIVRGCRTKVRALYQSVMNSKDDNLYTLAVVSRPVRDVIPVTFKCDLRRFSCLYTGDLDLNVKDKGVLLQRFKSLIDYSQIGTVQVPHHGSKLNWRDDFLDGMPRTFFVSAGSTNTYHHPDYWVMHGIEANNKLYVVSEDPTSIYRDEFYIC